jgi:hypothetical protein
MVDVTYEDYQDLVRKLSLANERVRDLQERVSGREAYIAVLEAKLVAKDAELAAMKVSNNKWLAKWERAEARLAEAENVTLRMHLEALSRTDAVKVGYANSTAPGNPFVTPATEGQQDAVVVSVADINTWRAEWLDANDPQDGTDCVTPFDKYLYTRPER